MSTEEDATTQIQAALGTQDPSYIKSALSYYGETLRRGSSQARADLEVAEGYLEQLEAIEGRWDVFFSRFELLGALNPEFVQQTDGFLKSMGMNAADFRQILREAHELMRADAQAERDAMA